MPENASLRIALLTHSVNPRGGVVHTLELANALHAAGHAVTVFAPAAPGQRLFREPACRVSLVPVAGTPRDMVAMVRSRIDAFTRHLGGLLARGGHFDVWHTHDSIGGNALADLQAGGRIGGFVRTVHHLDHFDEPQLMQWQQRAFEAATQVFTVSRLWRERLAEAHGVEAMQVDNGIDMARFSPVAQPEDVALAQRLGIEAGGPIVLAMGGVEERKNTVRLLQAFARLHAARPGARLLIAGGVSLLDHAAYARRFDETLAALGWRAGPEQPVQLLGAIADADMPRLYRLADVVAMPSTREGFGLVVLEALASGVPVVASRIAPFTDHLTDADVSWADPLSAPSIADALVRALNTGDAQRTAASATRLARRFSWPASAARHVQLYRAGLAHAAPALAQAA